MRHFILATCACLFAITATASAQDNVDLGQITERHEMIPMRDGQRLSAYLYFPQGAGPWPVLFEQRYADIRGAGTRKAAAKLAEADYVVALVNFRGTHQSEGTWIGYRALGWGELQDGFDTCEWLARQSWSTGKVGTFGSSQGGYAQNFLAVTQPPHLVCQYMVDTGLSLFQEGYRIGGVTRPERFKAMDNICRNPEDNRKLMEEWFRHPNYDDYWRQEDCSLHFAKMNVACFTIGSWFDFMNQGSIASFEGRQTAGGPRSLGKQQLVIGPWLHGRLNKGNRVGELVFPENAAWPEYDHMVRWFNHWLKAEDNGVEREPAVRYYVMGAVGEEGAPGNTWRTVADWAPANEPRFLYLQADGKLSREAPTTDTGATKYTSDPHNPMQIPGSGFPGARDARPFEQQAEVRTFTTDPLEEPVEWTGRVRAEIHLSSTARDTDILVRVSDVYPDGRSILLIDYPMRARYREGFDHQALLEPGQIYKLEYNVGWLSQIFNRGHRIRVTIASTGSPLYEPNPQTGGPQTIEFPADAVKAENTIHHSRMHASRIIAPVAARRQSAAPQGRSPIRRFTGKGERAGSAAVVVGDVPLVHTTQLLPVDETGSVVPQNDAALQIDRVLAKLSAALQGAGSGLDGAVKLNWYVAREELAELVRRKVAETLPSDQQPVLSIVVTPLPIEDALVAADAVAATAPAREVARHSASAVMPPGSRINVSGQAEPGTLREATRKTLESLSSTLKFCGRTDGDIVQLKCFLQPMAAASEVTDEIEKYFGKDKAPPVSYVGWKSNLPIEIELVAWGGPSNAAAKEPLEFLTPPAMKASPLYSRVVRVNRGNTIFFSDLAGTAGASNDQQLEQSFEGLRELLAQTGSDFNHLVKATYYVTTDEASRAHNAIRPKYYDPARPPAASKALVAGTGRPGVPYVMDMIAVPSK